MRSIWAANEKYGKSFLVAVGVAIWLIILLLFKIYGYNETWKLWRVPVEPPQFSDFRLIPGSAESFRRGLSLPKRIQMTHIKGYLTIQRFGGYFSIPESRKKIPYGPCP